MSKVISLVGQAKKHDKRLIVAVALAWAVAEFTKDKSSVSLRSKIVHDFANAVIKTGTEMR